MALKDLEQVSPELSGGTWAISGPSEGEGACALFLSLTLDFAWPVLLKPPVLQAR